MNVYVHYILTFLMFPTLFYWFIMLVMLWQTLINPAIKHLGPP